jgi:hypothetical protein
LTNKIAAKRKKGRKAIHPLMRIRVGIEKGKNHRKDSGVREFEWICVAAACGNWAR